MVGMQMPTTAVAASMTQRVILHGISWQTYIQILTELGDHRASRLAYAQGVLEITMPSNRHETHKKLLKRMIETLTDCISAPDPKRSFKICQSDGSMLPSGASQWRRSGPKLRPSVREPLPGKNGPH
jgi:hypothetical protein